jgi:hypothetical protein
LTVPHTIAGWKNFPEYDLALISLKDRLIVIQANSDE